MTNEFEQFLLEHCPIVLRGSNMHLSPIDWLIMLVYFVFVLGIGDRKSVV